MAEEVKDIETKEEDVSLLTDEDKDVTLLSEDEEKKAEDKKETKDDDGDKSTPEKDLKEDDSTKDVAPDKYEDFTIPEGSEVDEAKLNSFAEVAKGAKLSQEDAQKFVDLYAATRKEAADEQVKAWATVQEGWVNEAKNDPELGGDKFQETIVTAKNAIKILGSEKLVEALDVTGMGNHPEFIRFFAKVGRAIGEDQINFGRGGSGETPKSPAEILFPNQNK